MARSSCALTSAKSLCTLRHIPSGHVDSYTSISLKCPLTRSSPVTLHFHRLCWTWKAKRSTLPVKTKAKKHSEPQSSPCPWSLGLLLHWAVEPYFPQPSFWCLQKQVSLVSFISLTISNPSQALAFLTPPLHPQAMARLYSPPWHFSCVSELCQGLPAYPPWPPATPALPSAAAMGCWCAFSSLSFTTHQLMWASPRPSWQANSWQANSWTSQHLLSWSPGL